LVKLLIITLQSQIF